MYKSNKTCSGSICQKVQNTTERNQRPERHRVPGLEDSTLQRWQFSPNWFDFSGWTSQQYFW